MSGELKAIIVKLKLELDETRRKLEEMRQERDRLALQLNISHLSDEERRFLIDLWRPKRTNTRPRK